MEAGAYPATNILKTRWTPVYEGLDDLLLETVIAEDWKFKCSHRGSNVAVEQEQNTFPLQATMRANEVRNMYSEFLFAQFRLQNKHDCDLCLHDEARRFAYKSSAIVEMTPPHMYQQLYTRWHLDNLHTPFRLSKQDCELIQLYRENTQEFTEKRNGLPMVIRECVMAADPQIIEGVKGEWFWQYRSRHIECQCTDTNSNKFPILTEIDKVRYVYPHL